MTHQSDDTVADQSVVNREEIANEDIDAKFLCDLSSQRTGVVLTGLDLATGKLPLPTGGAVGATAASQHQTATRNDGSDNSEWRRRLRAFAYRLSRRHCVSVPWGQLRSHPRYVVTAESTPPRVTCHWWRQIAERTYRRSAGSHTYTYVPNIPRVSNTP